MNEQEQSLIDRLYDKTGPGASEAPQTTDAPASPMAERLYGKPDLDLELNQYSAISDLRKKYSAGPPDAATEQAWLTEVQTRYGQEDMELARDMVVRDKNLKEMLEKTRLGNHPEVVKIMIALARAEKRKGSK